MRKTEEGKFIPKSVNFEAKFTTSAIDTDLSQRTEVAKKSINSNGDRTKNRRKGLIFPTI
jgi:hypothetical protein